MDVYNKVGFADRVDTKPSSYLIDGEVKTIEKDNSGVKKEGSNLNAENLNHMDEGIFKNSQNIKKLDETVTKHGTSIKDLGTQYEDTTNKLNNLGGRNYLVNSDFRNKENKWITYKNGEGCTIKFNDGNIVINNVSRDYCGIYQVIKDICIQKSQKYIMSFYAKADKDLDILCGWTSHGVNCRVRESNDYIRYSISIGSPQNDNADTIIVYNATQGSNVDITKIQVECGDVASDWNLAPEEVIINSKRLDAIEKILIDKGYMTVTQKL